MASQISILLSNKNCETNRDGAEVVRLLVAAGCDPAVRNTAGQTASEYKKSRLPNFFPPDWHEIKEKRENSRNTQPSATQQLAKPKIVPYLQHTVPLLYLPQNTMPLYLLQHVVPLYSQNVMPNHHMVFPCYCINKIR